MRELPDVAGFQTRFADRSCEQLRRAIVSHYEKAQSVGHGDLAGLIRHVICRCSLLTGDGERVWTVPNDRAWPSKKDWQDANIRVAGEDQNSFRLQASKAWRAEWLEQSDQFDPFENAYRETDRREGWPSTPVLPLDTALQYGLRLPFASYQGPGQRLAVRAAFFLKPGATLVVNLPTGTGKSLVAWSPALLADSNQLTVMITPTIALSIDQERQLHERYPYAPGGLPSELAWHSGLSEDSRKQIRNRLRNNSQRILIASPESFVGSLSRELYKTAERGLLKYLVVDEAHLVAQWGNDFRPEFQAMSGMRRDLLRVCPANRKFRTLLLSATLTQESFDVLESLFSDGDFDSVNAVSLRPEPEYWISSSQFKLQRERKVVELLKLVPRPFLLYVTTKQDAEFWFAKFRDLGIRRCGCVHGGTANEQRERVIDRWRNGEIDCVVATSAFGLGMDKGDVRAVIHACMPESIDRYYQEVGRAGRDGKASVSFLLPCPDADESTARSISNERIISLQKGFSRWSDMIKSDKATCNNGIWKVDLSTRPSRIQQDSEANVAWNLRTLVLLNRAGLIRLESSSPPDLEKEESEAEVDFERRRHLAMEEYFSTAYLTICEFGHLDEAVWEAKVKAERGRMFAASSQSFTRMDKLHRGKAEVGELLQQTYSITTETGGAVPEHFCSGCPVCRTRASENRSAFRHPQPDPIGCIEYGDIAALKQLFRVQAEVVFVRMDGILDQRELQNRGLRFAEKLVAKGIAELAIPEIWKENRKWKSLHSRSDYRFVLNSSLIDYDDYQNDLRLPRATFMLDSEEPIVPQPLINMNRPFHIIFAPEHTLEAGSRRLFFEITPHIRDYDLDRRLGE
jgi:ATP-dependent DNA helicase RecQ